MSRQLCTWPRERHYPDSCHRKPQLGRGLRLRVTTFPGGAGAPASVLPAGTSIWGRGGSGQGGGFFYEFPLVCLSFLCMLYPLPILPFSSLCHQKLPAALWARSAPPGGPTPVWMLDKRLWPFRDTGLASPGRRQSKPIGTPPAL